MSYGNNYNMCVNDILHVHVSGYHQVKI